MTWALSEIVVEDVAWRRICGDKTEKKAAAPVSFYRSAHLRHQATAVSATLGNHQYGCCSAAAHRYRWPVGSAAWRSLQRGEGCINAIALGWWLRQRHSPPSLSSRSAANNRSAALITSALILRHHRR
jgi:hypothetical protein